MSTEDTPKPAGLPEPDTHCWDDDTGKEVWSYGPELMRATIDAAAAKERERCAAIAESWATEETATTCANIAAVIRDA